MIVTVLLEQVDAIIIADAEALLDNLDLHALTSQ